MALDDAWDELDDGGVPGIAGTQDHPSRRSARRAVTPARRPARRWLTALTGLVALALLSLAVPLVVVPHLLGGMSLTVLTGSMRPGIQPGDVVVTRGIDRAQAQNLAVGDIIAFLPYPDDPTLVTHRIVSITVDSDGTAFITQGDNNNAPDPWGPVRDFQVRGKVLYTIPKVGYLRQSAGSSLPWIVPTVAGLLFVYAAVALIGSFRRRDDSGDEPPTVTPVAELPDETLVIVRPGATSSHPGDGGALSGPWPPMT